MINLVAKLRIVKLKRRKKKKREKLDARAVNKKCCPGVLRRGKAAVEPVTDGVWLDSGRTERVLEMA